MELQKKLLAVARALGMKPILSAFAGHVPEELKALMPKAIITQIRPGWGGLSKDHSCWFLDPLDPLFAEIQKRFLTTQTDLYGNDHRYAADPFNEINPPSWEPDFMASVGKGIYDSMAAADPDAIWYQMTWTFSYNGKWTKKSADGRTPLSALCEAVPKGKTMLIDYVGEEREMYKSTDQFYGCNFLWNYLGNYGGNTYFRAPLNTVSKRIEAVLPVENCAGIGCTLEGLACNPKDHEMILEQPWHADGAIDEVRPPPLKSALVGEIHGRDPALLNRLVTAAGIGIAARLLLASLVALGAEKRP